MSLLSSLACAPHRRPHCLGDLLLALPSRYGPASICHLWAWKLQPLIVTVRCEVMSVPATASQRRWQQPAVFSYASRGPCISHILGSCISWFLDAHLLSRQALWRQGGAPCGSVSTNRVAVQPVDNSHASHGSCNHLYAIQGSDRRSCACQILNMPFVNTDCPSDFLKFQ